MRVQSKQRERMTAHSIRIPDEMQAALEALSAKLSVPVAVLIRLAVKQYLGGQQ